MVEALARAGHEISRSALRRCFDRGQVRCEGEALSPSFVPEAILRIEVVLPVSAASLRAEPEPMALSILHEDADVLVLDKPAGVVVHPAVGHPSGTLTGGVLHHLGVEAEALPILPGNDEARPGVVHRLDRDTSGVIVFAKTARAASALADQFRVHSSERRYVGVLAGRPNFETQLVETSHARDPTDRKRFAPQVPGATRRAVSHVRIVEVLRHGAVARFELQTGRTHQIRMHARHLGLPIFGDDLYAKAPRDATRRALWRSLGRHALHAESLGFEHPDGSGFVRFEAVLPRELVVLIDALR